MGTAATTEAPSNSAETALEQMSDSDLLRHAEQFEACDWHANHLQNVLARALRELHALRQEQGARAREARRHAIELEQCALFAADVGESIAKAMTDAAAFLRKEAETGDLHSDDLAVNAFASTMKAKLAKKRAEGRGGWQEADCTEQRLSNMLREHVEKGDPVDVANFAMMLHQRRERIVAPYRPGRENEREELLAYILQDDLQNRLTPRLVDLGYTAWSSGRLGKNKEDGGPCDWFTDTKPVVDEVIAKIRRDLEEAEKVQRAGGMDA